MTNDILSQLMSEDRLSRDIVEAPHGSLVIASGTIVFMDRSLIRMAALVTSEISEKEEANFEVTDVSPEGQATINFSLRQLFSNFEFPSAFLLQNEQTSVCGTLKESGMEEPIPTYYFKHGNAGLSNVHLIGVKEVSNASLTLGESHLLGITQGLAQSLSKLLMPSDAIRVTPIAIFREL